MNGERRDGNEELREQGFEIIPEEELAEGTTRVTFFGEARYVPEVGESVEVQDEGGVWRGGFKVITGVASDGGSPVEDDVVWICTDEEWGAAEHEDRSPAGSPRSLEQVRAAGDGVG